MITIVFVIFFLCIGMGFLCPPMMATAIFPGVIIAMWLAGGIQI